MKYEKCNVVMLPIEKAIKGCIFKSKYDLFTGNKGDIDDFNNGDTSYTPQHLYIINPNEEIKEGDYYYDNFNKKIKKSTCNITSLAKNRNQYYKIIATTDESLRIDVGMRAVLTDRPELVSLPRPSNEFLKKYCELGGINQVMVEYERDEKALPVFDGKYEFIKPERLKVAPDNTITIKPIKESWSREEVIEIAKNYAKRCQAPIQSIKWLEENL